MRKHFMATVALSALLASGAAVAQTQQPPADDAAQASEPADAQPGVPDSVPPLQTPAVSAEEGGEAAGAMTGEPEAAAEETAAVPADGEATAGAPTEDPAAAGTLPADAATTDAAPEDTAATGTAPADTSTTAAVDPAQYMGRDIVAADGEKVGEVQRIIVGDQGQPEALVFKSGGFLGLGGKEVEVAWDQVQTEGEQLLLNMQPEQIAELPEARPEVEGEAGAGAGAEAEAEAGAAEGEEATQGQTAQ